MEMLDFVLAYIGGQAFSDHDWEWFNFSGPVLQLLGLEKFHWFRKIRKQSVFSKLPQIISRNYSIYVHRSIGISIALNDF